MGTDDDGMQIVGSAFISGHVDGSLSDVDRRVLRRARRLVWRAVVLRRLGLRRWAGRGEAELGQLTEQLAPPRARPPGAGAAP